MNVTDAAYDTVHQYPGGSEALAPRLGMSAAVLRGKVNPNTDRNLLSLQEADALDDGRISPNEADAIARGCAAVMARLVQVSQHAEAAAERGGA